MQTLLNGVETFLEDIVETVGQFRIDGEMAVGAPRASNLYAPHSVTQVVVKLISSLLTGRIDNLLTRWHSRAPITVLDIAGETATGEKRDKSACADLPPVVDAIVDSDWNGEESLVVVDIHKTRPITAADSPQRC